MSPLPQQGKEGYVSVTQPLGQPDEPGACWKMTLGGKSTQGFWWQVACDPHPEQLALAENQPALQDQHPPGASPELLIAIYFTSPFFSSHGRFIKEVLSITFPIPALNCCHYDAAL